MTDTATETTEAERYAQEALELLNSIKTGQWITPGLSAGGGLAPLDATMRPIDELSGAGLNWLTPYVQPLQAVLDRMAGNASVIQSFADAWQRAAAKVEEIRAQLARRADAETSEWHGLAGDRYRRRAQELTFALDAAAHVSEATGIVAKQMGEAVADARRQVNDLLTDLVHRLISYAKQAVAVEGGVTPNVVAQCTSMINSYQGPISAIEQRLQQTLDSIQPPTAQPSTPQTGSGTGEKILDAVATIAGALSPSRVVTGIARIWGGIRSVFGRRGSAQQQREVDRTYAQRERERQQQQNKDWQRNERSRYRGSEYSQGMEKVYGPPPNDGNTYVGHHNFPVKYGRRFEELGIDTSNPAWGSWVRETDHQGFSTQFENDWTSFFQNNPNATRTDAFNFVRELGNKYGYKIPF